MSVKVVDRMPEFIRGNNQGMNVALARMAQDIKILAIARAPYKSGDMQRTASDPKIADLKYRVEFDTDYAAYQERGARRDGTRVVRRYSTPSTGKGFLKDAGSQISEKAVNYFIQAANQVRVTV